jgi:tetratricopeptide (TPR) repeat protein
MAGEPRRALEILKPCLDPEKEDTGANPYTFALAARIHCSLGQEDQARRRLQQAVQSFEMGLSDLRRSQGQVPHSFREYTVAIMLAAAELGEHRQVFELYRRWESHHVSWENKLLAAVACFNLGRYRRAANLWSSLAQISGLFSGMQQVAFLVERGVIPPFQMGYKFYSKEKLQAMIKEAAASEEARRQYMQDGFFRMMLLAWLLEGNSPQAFRGMYDLIYYGDEWGEKLGRQVLNDSGFSPALKIAAAEALTARGILREDEPVPMVIDGERRLVKIETTPVLPEPDEELDGMVNRAIKLQGEGKIEEAVEMLLGIFREGKFYPPAMVTLANLLRLKGDLDEALNIMEMLEQLEPDNPFLLFNLSLLMLEKGEVAKARQYLARIDDPEFEKEHAEKLEALEREIERKENAVLLSEMSEMIMRAYEEDERRKIEEKPLPVDAPLSRGLKNMPAHWLEGACIYYGFEPARQRRQREEQLRQFLSRRDNLEKAVGELEEEERELLKYLLQRGGWSRLNAVTRKFGSLEGDGYFWQEREPESLLGFLWSLGLVMVGKATLEGRRVKIATIPLELRQPLREILGI